MDDEEEKRAEARRADGACLAISRDEAEIYFPKKDIKNDDCDAVRSLRCISTEGSCFLKCGFSMGDGHRRGKSFIDKWIVQVVLPFTPY